MRCHLIPILNFNKTTKASTQRMRSPNNWTTDWLAPLVKGQNLLYFISHLFRESERRRQQQWRRWAPVRICHVATVRLLGEKNVYLLHLIKQQLNTITTYTFKLQFYWFIDYLKSRIIILRRNNCVLCQSVPLWIINFQTNVKTI